jgi:iron(III) transport system ATP-binding protein
MTFLTVQGIGKRYGTLTALDGIELAIAAGSHTAVVGPSGSGKTTLLRIIAGFETPDVGRITLDGQLLADGPDTVPPHRRSIGFTAQEGAVFPHLSVAENIGFGLERNLPQRDQRILELMDMVELARAMRDQRPHQLSGGQQQRVALARALARKPKLMLLDEPFSALDTGLRETMRRAVARTLRAAGVTALMVTHDQAEALSFADTVAVLRGGRLMQVGEPRSLYLNPRDRETALFLGDALILPAEIEEGLAVCCLGRVAVDAGGRGTGEIMLRPEQLRLEPVPATASTSLEPAGCYGRVLDIEFGGAVSLVTVALRNAAAATPLLIRCASIDLPPIDAQVRITVRGKAHVFER